MTRRWWIYAILAVYAAAIIGTGIVYFVTGTFP